MRQILIAALAALGLTTCNAQSSVRAPVPVAFELYVGCIKGTLKSATVPHKVQDVRPYVESLNQYCMTWMLVWYPAMMGDLQRELSEEEIIRLSPMIDRVLYDLDRQFTDFARKKSLTK
jgi:hypothetical protein